MPTDIAASASNVHEPVINAPAGGDPRTSASVRDPMQKIVNRTRWLWSWLQGVVGSFAPIGALAPSAIASVNTSTDTITLTTHGLDDGDPVRFISTTLSSFGGISWGVVYYVVNKTTDTFQVEASVGGGAINITSFSGTVYVIKVTDPEVYLPTVGGVIAGKLSAILGRFVQLDDDNAFTGDNTHAGTETFADINVGTGDHYGVSGRSETRDVDATPSNVGGNWNETSTGTFSDTGTGGSILYFPLKAPKGQTITAFEITIDPAGGHGALPATMPVVQLVKTDRSTGVLSIVSTVTDSASNVGAYETAHSFGGSGLTEVATPDTHRYGIRLTSETGANAVAGLVAHRPSVTYTRTWIGED
jgi:hypothetical protein